MEASESGRGFACVRYDSFLDQILAGIDPDYLSRTADRQASLSTARHPNCVGHDPANAAPAGAMSALPT
jgi:hypothetical protein